MISVLRILIFSVILAGIVAVKSPNSPDYTGYEKYLDISDALERFPLEPISALALGLSGTIGRLEAFYFICTLFYCISCFIYLSSLGKSNFISWFCIVVNPFSIIIFLSPRNCLGIALVILALSFRSRVWSALVTIFAFGSHNLGAAASIISRFCFYRKVSYIRYISVIGITVATWIALSGMFSETRLDLINYALEADEERGTLRGIYFIIFCLYVLICRTILALSWKIYLWPVFVAILSFYINSINPFFNRVVTSLFIFAYFYIIEVSSEYFIRVVLLPILFLNLVVFIGAITMGFWGY